MVSWHQKNAHLVKEALAMTSPSAGRALEDVVPSHPAHRLRGRGLFLALAVWLVLAAGLLANFVFGIAT